MHIDFFDCFFNEFLTLNIFCCETWSKTVLFILAFIFQRIIVFLDKDA